MKLVSLLLGFFSFTLALGSEASGTLLQESEETTATVSVPGPPSDPDAVAMWIDDLGRLTPFGRTFDVYIQTGFDPDFPTPTVILVVLT